MKKIILSLAVCLLPLHGLLAQGSSNVNHLNLCVGALYERGFDATLSYEHETKYHHSWEYFANAYIQYDTDLTIMAICVLEPALAVTQGKSSEQDTSALSTAMIFVVAGACSGR